VAARRIAVTFGVTVGERLTVTISGGAGPIPASSISRTKECCMNPFLTSFLAGAMAAEQISGHAKPHQHLDDMTTKPWELRDICVPQATNQTQPIQFSFGTDSPRRIDFK
jgi:hypothetical protein